MPRVIVEWPAWYHGPDGHSAIFDSFNEVPAGWVRKRPPLFVPVRPAVIDEVDVRTKLIELGVAIDPSWGKAQLQKVLDSQ